MIDYSLAVSLIRQGGIIAHPTEAVFGLACDPFNAAAVERLFNLKQRSHAKNFILIAANWQQLSELIAPMTEEQLKPAMLSWPGPVTWVFPAADTLPGWLTGADHTIALRITAHPIAAKLCESYGHALISSSANISTQPPCTSYEETLRVFGDKIDLVIDGAVGDLSRPTPIYNILTGDVIRT